jgi:sugar lactone lactonase YvrE
VVGGGAIAAAGDRPETIALPDGFQPEGIAAHGDSFFVGSIPTGAIYAGSLRTGEGSVLVPGQEGRSAIGLSLKRSMLFVAGGETGAAHVYDARNGEELASLQLTTEPTFVNDVVATRDAAYFTDSMNQVIYRVAIEPGGGFGEPETIPVTGDLVYEEGFNANGIDATRNGRSLVVVQSNTGELFEVDALTGASTEIDLGGETVANGDGILLDGGRRLWVVRNRDNLLVEVRLEPDLSAGTIVDERTDDGFDVPTTVARAGSRLALVNARFGIREPETAEYWVTQIRR